MARDNNLKTIHVQQFEQRPLRWSASPRLLKCLPKDRIGGQMEGPLREQVAWRAKAPPGLQLHTAFFAPLSIMGCTKRRIGDPSGRRGARWNGTGADDAQGVGDLAGGQADHHRRAQ